MNRKGKFDRLSPVHKKFYYWIEKKGLLRRFSANLDGRLQTWKLLDYLDDVSLTNTPDTAVFYNENLIGCAFDWKDSIQGLTFWGDLDVEWVEYYKTLKS